MSTLEEVLENPRMMQRLYADKTFSYGIALRLLKAGYRVYRKGWYVGGMWVCYQKGYPEGIAINKNTAAATGIQEGTVCLFEPYFLLKTAAPVTTFVHWQPSTPDIMAEDWMIAWNE